MHCRRELMHGTWTIILDDDFIHACTFGIVILCVDGIERRVYPRIFTYSADYPEKYALLPITLFDPISHLHIRVLLATIRDNGLFPCHRCLVSKYAIHKLGCLDDIKFRIEKTRTYLAGLVKKARKCIYKDAKAINGTAVDDVLKETSGVPTMVRCSHVLIAMSYNRLVECLCWAARP